MQRTLIPDVESTSSSGEEAEDEDVREYDNEVFDEDLYGLTAVSIIRDSAVFSSNKTREAKSRCVRMAFAIGLVFANIALQVYLLVHVKALITKKSVRDIREVYGKYEKHMYDGHVTYTVNGFARGMDNYFKKENFDTMHSDEQLEVCQFPLSQPHFFAVILIIWSLTCISELKNAIRLFRLTFILPPTVNSMASAVELDEQKGIVVGLTWAVKFIILFTLVVPRFCVTCFLCWLGCRWLLATPSFADLVLNAVALEFILATNDLLYRTVVPLRNKLDIATTEVCLDRAGAKSEPGSVRVYILGAIWVLVALVWCYLYMYHFQTVLPEYRYDIHEICVTFLATKFSDVAQST